MKKTTVAGAVIAALVTPPLLPGFPASQAFANGCESSTYHKVMWKSNVYVLDRINGKYSLWNKKDDGAPVTQTVTYGYSDTKSVAKHWEVGASAGISWAIVKADISSKYGRAYTDAATSTKTWSASMTVKDGWTGWWQALFYRRVVKWAKYHYVWSSQQQNCVKQVVAQAYWGDPKLQYAAIKKQGHAYP